jgi:murein DD-endopeptidase MepM/ murein hydrolase activator NlpD
MRLYAAGPRRVVLLCACLIASNLAAPPWSVARPASRLERAAPARAAVKAELKAVNQKMKDAKAKLSDVKGDIKDTKDALHQKKQQMARLSDQIRELEYRQVEAGKRVKGAERRLSVAEHQLEEATHRLQKAQERLRAHRKRLAVRIRRSYTAGTVTFVDVLVRASSLADFLDRQYYVERIFSSDMDFLTELREEQQAVIRIRAEVERKRDERLAAREEMGLQLHEVQGLTLSRKDLFHRIENEKELKEEELRELQQDSQSIAVMLEGEWTRRQRLWQQLYHGRVPMTPWVGHWLRPVANCPITSGFGMRYHPLLHYTRMHTGIDFAAPLGTPVRAAADGEVVWASWRGGYGRCIILLHGGGVATLYAHCFAIVVHPGQSVKQGQPIGLSGTSGLSTGPHLHFEMRYHGLPVNPIGR